MPSKRHASQGYIESINSRERKMKRKSSRLGGLDEAAVGKKSELTSILRRRIHDRRVEAAAAAEANTIVAALEFRDTFIFQTSYDV